MLNDGSLSGLSEAEAREFHSVFMTSFLVFVVVAVVAHILAWMWRPGSPARAAMHRSTMASPTSALSCPC